MKYFTITILLTVSIFYESKGQDIHFSKFLSAPLILNPANTTNYNGNWSLITNYRKQGVNTSDAYITSTVAFDFPVYIKTERLGLGLIWINDESANSTLSVNKLFLSSAYFVKTSSNSYLHLGMQVGYVHKKLDFNNLTYPDQFDMTTGYFNSDIFTNETLINSSLSYLDLNWGLIWSYKTKKFTSEMGIAMFHYNTPNESFSEINYELKPRYEYHIFIEKLLLNNYFVKPKLLYVNQNLASELLLGLDGGMIFQNKKNTNKLYLGAFFRGGFNRNPDAYILKIGFNYKSADISFSYDFEISDYDTYVYAKNSFELSLSFKLKETNVRNKVIPCTIF